MQTPSLEQLSTFTDSPGVAAFGAILIATGFALAPLTAAIVRRVFRDRDPVVARWRYSHLVRVALFMFGVAQVFLHSTADGPDLVVLLVSNSVLFGAACALIAWFAHENDPSALHALGFRSGRNLRAIAAGLIAFVLLRPALLGVSLVWPWLLARLRVPFELPLIEQKFLSLPEREIAFVIVLGTLVQPLLEEILFRAFLQPLLVQRFRATGGIVITSIAFAALHGTAAFLPIFALSLLLGAIMLHTQRLTAVWTMHAINNGMGFCLLVVQRHPEWLHVKTGWLSTF